MVEKILHFVPNNDGWELALRQRVDPKALKKNRRPVAIFPGYGMNSFIFGYHPKKMSYEEYLASRGFEVWSIDMRKQGPSKKIDKAGDRIFGLKELITIDYPAALDYIAENTKSTDKSGKIDCLGCSLAGSLLAAYFVLCKNNRVGALVSLGAPIRWVEIPAFVKMMFTSNSLIGLIPFKKSRELAGFFLPKLVKIPHLLDLYIHKEHTDMNYADQIIKTVEDPVPEINREISEWTKSKDLIMNGVNISEGLSKFTNPVLCVIANADGIVPPPNVRVLKDLVGSKVKDEIVIGNDKLPFAHADLFVSDYAEELHFKLVADWLEGLYGKEKAAAEKTVKKPAAAGAKKKKSA